MTTLPQRIIALHASIGIVKAGESLTLQVDDDHLRRHGATRLDLFPGPPPLDVRAAARTLTPSASLLVSDQRIPTGYSGAITATLDLDTAWGVAYLPDGAPIASLIIEAPNEPRFTADREPCALWRPSHAARGFALYGVDDTELAIVTDDGDGWSWENSARPFVGVCATERDAKIAAEDSVARLADEIRETLRQRAPVVTERDKAIAAIPRAVVVQ